jgi:cell division protein FtsB
VLDHVASAGIGQRERLTLQAGEEVKQLLFNLKADQEAQQAQMRVLTAEEEVVRQQLAQLQVNVVGWLGFGDLAQD